MNNDWYYDPPEPRGTCTEVPCSDCKGTGEVVNEMISDDGTEPAMVECPTCDGSGVVERWSEYDPDDYPDDDR